MGLLAHSCKVGSVRLKAGPASLKCGSGMVASEWFCTSGKPQGWICTVWCELQRFGAKGASNKVITTNILGLVDHNSQLFIIFACAAHRAELSSTVHYIYLPQHYYTFDYNFSIAAE